MGHDKWLHAIVGASLFVWGASLGLHGPLRFLPVLTVAVGKEAWDQNHGARDMREHRADVAWTMAGAGVASLLLHADRKSLPVPNPKHCTPKPLAPASLTLRDTVPCR